MTLLAFEWPKIITKPTKCDGEDLARAHSPCAVTKPQCPRHFFSYLCIQKCPSNGSIIIETLIKILKLKDKQIGRDLATRSVSRWCRAALHIAGSKSAPITLVGGSKGARPLTDDTGGWLAWAAHTRLPSSAIHIFLVTIWISIYVNIKETRYARSVHVGLTGTASTGYFGPLAFFFFVLSVCPHFPPTSDLHFSYSDSPHLLHHSYPDLLLTLALSFPSFQPLLGFFPLLLSKEQRWRKQMNITPGLRLPALPLSRTLRARRTREPQSSN